ncbi:hypothetical protein AB0L67_41560 [Streptomyces flaveolus]
MIGSYTERFTALDTAAQLLITAGASAPLGMSGALVFVPLWLTSRW